MTYLTSYSGYRQLYCGKYHRFAIRNVFSNDYFVSCLDVGHVACIMDTLYVYLILDFGNPAGLSRLTP